MELVTARSENLASNIIIFLHINCYFSSQPTLWNLKQAASCSYQNEWSPHTEEANELTVASSATTLTIDLHWDDVRGRGWGSPAYLLEADDHSWVKFLGEVLHALDQRLLTADNIALA